MSIHDFADIIKGRWKKTLAAAGKRRSALILGLIMAAACGASFWIGYTARGQVALASSAAASDPLASAPLAQAGSAALLPSPALDSGPSVTAPSVPALFVASKNGKKYYPADCPSAARIKADNKVTFTSEARARAAGYVRAGICT